MPRSLTYLLVLTTSAGCVGARPATLPSSIASSVAQTIEVAQSSSDSQSPVSLESNDNLSNTDILMTERSSPAIKQCVGEEPAPVAPRESTFADLIVSDDVEFQLSGSIQPSSSSQLSSSIQLSRAVEQPGQAEAIIEGQLPTESFLGASRFSAPMEINLPSALAMIDGGHPLVGFAQWRVQEAYAELIAARALWLPSIQAGFSAHRHDGNYQASNGDIVDVNRNSFQYGLGMGSTGAGTTPRPGLVAQFHLADAIFRPDIAEKTAWARSHAANAVTNRQLLKVSLAYTELLASHQLASVLAESQARAKSLAKITKDFAEAGEGLQSDADRLETEVTLLESRQIAAKERIAVASARLAQTLSLDGGTEIQPLDVSLLPIHMASTSPDPRELIRMGLSTRPELKESQALVAAACEAFQREKYAPMVPSVALGFSTSGFGGGLDDNLSNVSGRYDFDAMMSWEIRNLGFGEKAARRSTSARVQQARYEKLRVMDQIALEITQTASQIQFRQQRIDACRRAIESATSSYERNLSRIGDGEGLPLEVLQSVQALEMARVAYLGAVLEHNQAQFQLQWALGWPIQTG